MPDDKGTIVKMAFVYAQEGEWYRAIEEYKKLLSMDPEDPHVHTQIADAYAKKKDDAEALQYFLKSREIYERLGNTLKVAAVDKKISKLSPDQMDLKQRQFFRSLTQTQEAEGMVGEGRTEDAVSHYQRMIAAEPVNFSYREKLISLHMESAQVTEAAVQLKAMADLHLTEGRFELAQDYANRLAQLDPGGLDTLRLMAVLAKQKGNQEETSNHYGKLAQLAFDSGHYQEALGAVETAVQAGNGGLKLLQAKTLLALKKGPEAKALFGELLRENPEDDALLEQMVNLSEETRDWSMAYVHLGELMKRRAGDAKLLPRMARVLLQTGKRTEALQIYFNLGLAALTENRVDSATAYFDSILALEPENIDVLKKKAEIFLKQGKKQEVIDVYKKLQAIFNQKKMTDEAKKVGLILVKLSAMKG